MWAARETEIFRPLRPLRFPALACQPQTPLPCSLPAPQGTVARLPAARRGGPAGGSWQGAVGRGRAGGQPGPPRLPSPRHCGREPADTELWACRAAATMWRAMVSTSRTAEKVLPELLCVLEDWPLHSTSTSDGDYVGVFALAVSFWTRPLLTPSIASPGGSPSSPTTASPCLTRWAGNLG